MHETIFIKILKEISLLVTIHKKLFSVSCRWVLENIAFSGIVGMKVQKSLSTQNTLSRFVTTVRGSKTKTY